MPQVFFAPGQSEVGMLSGAKANNSLRSSWFGTKTTMNQAVRSNPATRCQRSSMARISRPAITTPHIVIIIFSRPSPTHLTLRDQITRRRPRRLRAFSSTIARAATAPTITSPGQRQHRHDHHRAGHFGRRRQQRHGHHLHRRNAGRNGAGLQQRLELRRRRSPEQRQPHHHRDLRPRQAAPVRLASAPDTRSPSMRRPPLRRRRSPARPTAASTRRPPRRPLR